MSHSHGNATTRNCVVKLAKVKDRASLVVNEGVVDIEMATGGQFGAELEPIYDDWLGFVDVARTVTEATGPLIEMDLGCPVSPRQVFAVGINYRSHSEESGVMVPEVPATFTKFPTCLC